MIKEALTILISDAKQIQWLSDPIKSIVRDVIGIQHKCKQNWTRRQQR
jgi:hypothetical protein